MRKITIKLTKKRFLTGFAAVVLLLAVIRLCFPGVAGERKVESGEWKENTSADISPSSFHSPLSSKKHRIRSVPSYAVAFPDTNAVQLVAAQQWGVTPVQNREDAEARKRELVYVAHIWYPGLPFFYRISDRHSTTVCMSRACRFTR